MHTKDYTVVKVALNLMVNHCKHFLFCHQINRITAKKLFIQTSHTNTIPDQSLHTAKFNYCSWYLITISWTLGNFIKQVFYLKISFIPLRWKYLFLEKNYLLQPASTEFKSGDSIGVKAQVQIISKARANKACVCV